MAAVSVRLFGRFDVTSDGRPTTALNTRRARELFGYLVLNRNRPQQREALAGLLWEDAAPEQSRKYLRQALWQLQTVLRPLGENKRQPVLEVDPEWIQLNGCESLRVDVECFHEATRCCQGIAGPQIDEFRRQRLEEAVSLYRGELLEGWYQEWCLLERERLRNDFLDTLEKLVCSCEAHRDSERGLAHARQMLAIDPAREQAHRHVMQLHFISGNRTEALRAFQRCEKLLLEEFGVPPSHQTFALYESIRARQAAAPGVQSSPAPAPGAHDQMPVVIELLERVQVMLAGVKASLRRDIGAPPEPE
jgi:DNA-binding SARP family transcriptional activator